MAAQRGEEGNGTAPVQGLEGGGSGGEGFHAATPWEKWDSDSKGPLLWNEFYLYSSHLFTLVTTLLTRVILKATVTSWDFCLLSFLIPEFDPTRIHLPTFKRNFPLPRVKLLKKPGISALV